MFVLNGLQLTFSSVALHNDGYIRLKMNSGKLDF